MGRISKKDRELLITLNNETIKEPSGAAKPEPEPEPAIQEPQPQPTLLKPKRVLSEKQLANLKAGREKRAMAKQPLAPIIEEPPQQPAEDIPPQKPKPKPKPKPRQKKQPEPEPEPVSDDDSVFDDEHIIKAVEPTAKKISSRTYEVIHRHEHVNYDASRHRPNPSKASNRDIQRQDTSSFFA